MLASCLSTEKTSTVCLLAELRVVEHWQKAAAGRVGKVSVDQLDETQ